MGENAPLTCWLENCGKNSLPLVGGKNASLGELINADIRVPPGFAVTTAGYQQFMRQNRLWEEIDQDLKQVDAEDMESLERISAKIRQRIEQAPFSLELEDLIGEYYRKLSVRSCVPAAPVAVRSSATAEDLPEASFAGLQDTYLWIRGVDAVLHHVRLCISSMFTARAMAYRKRMGFTHEEVAISVGVQKMANSFTAGVMFTLNPISGDRSTAVIDANFGFGESVVSGEVTPDHFMVNKVTMEVVGRNISKKEICYTVDPKTQRSKKSEVPFERQSIQSVVDEELIELTRMGKLIERHYGHPMDIEWAIDKDMPEGGNIFILQARPETVWSTKPVKAVSSGSKSPLEHIVASMMSGKKLR